MGNFTMFQEIGNIQYYLKESFNNSDRLLKEMGFANLEFIKQPFKNDYVINVVNSGIVKYVDGVRTLVDIDIILHKDTNKISIVDADNDSVIMQASYSDKLSECLYTHQEVLKRVLCGTDDLLRNKILLIDKDLSDEN